MSVRWSGFEEFQQALRQLPDALATEAGREAHVAGNAAAVAIRTEYGQHAITGHLRDSVEVQVQESGRFGVRVRVRVADPIAWIFDHGSQVRHWVQGKSTGKMWARRPPSHVVARAGARQRRAMFEQLKAMLVRQGFTVSGDA